MKQILEGQLSKYTNVMKGWQYRWFVLNPETGTLTYYMVSIEEIQTFSCLLSFPCFSLMEKLNIHVYMCKMKQ